MNNHVFADIAQARAELIEAVNSVPDHLFTVAPGEGEWSAGEVVAHLELVEKGITTILSRLLEREKEEGRPRSANTNGVGTTTLPPLPAERIRATPRSTPEQALSKGDALAAIATSRERLQVILEESLPYNLTERKFQHLILGDLNFYQWVLFIGVHERRHTGQIIRIRETLGTAA